VDADQAKAVAIIAITVLKLSKSAEQHCAQLRNP
jgi:hypothetical protein